MTGVFRDVDNTSSIGVSDEFANQDVNGILAGTAWTSSSLSFSFPGAASHYVDYHSTYLIDALQVLSAAQMDVVRYALALIAQYTTLSFSEMTETDTDHAILRYAGSANTPTSLGYYPATVEEAGDAFYGNIRDDIPVKGGYAYATLLHEIGHTLGLKHGYEDDGQHGVLPDRHNSSEWSIMTYPAYIGADPYYSNREGSGNQTYMIDDIAALQYLYGANYGANSGDTVYAWSPSDGETFIDGAGQGASSTNTVYAAIWDGGGTDTYDLSNYSSDLVLDLQAGHWSTFKAAQLADLDAAAPGVHLAHGNIANAHLYNGDARSLIENAIGGSGNDSLIGNPAGNRLDGRRGVDTLAGGAGNDSYVVDDALDVVDETSGLPDEIDSVESSLSYTLGANLEILTLTANAENGAGNGLANTLTGNDGDNRLDGQGGGDKLLGGAGNDVYVVDNALDVIDEASPLPDEIDSVESSVSYALGDHLENLTLISADNNIDATGNSLANILIGNGGNNQLDGQSGNDTLVGGLGNDVYVVDNSLDVVRETTAFSNEIDSVFASINYSLGANLENLTITGDGSSDGTGNGLANTLAGNGGNNHLDGLGGDDTLIGGVGNDTYVLDSSFDVIREASPSSGEIDSVEASVSYTLGANLENLTLSSSGNNDGTGNGQANIITGNSGNNRLDGQSGNDTLAGGAGNDVYVVDSALDQLSETVSLYSEIDGVESSVSYTLGSNLENLTLTGNNNINATGNSLANTLLGNGGNNRLDGQSGNDTLAGGAGNDVYIVDNSLDVVRETTTFSGEIDGVAASVNYALGDNLENLTLTDSGNSEGAGNALDNVLTGNSGNNRLNGLAGDDTLQGGIGNDSYVVDSVRDVIRESSTLSGEIDSVEASVNYTLGGNLETLLLTGSADIDGIGNNRANTLAGNPAANLLNGAGGADTLSGGLGNDTYVIDNAADVIIEASTSATEIDTVLSYRSTALGANLEKLTLFQVALNIDGVGNGLANVLTGNAGSNRLDALDGNDTLIGGLGADVCNGGLGSDRVVLNEAEAATDVVRIMTGESGTAGFDRVTGFSLGSNAGSTVGADKLDLAGNVIAADIGAGDGIDAGVIGSHRVDNGLISFDDVDAYAGALVLKSAHLGSVLSYLQNNLAGAATVAFVLENSTYVYQDGGVNADTLVQLIGITAAGLSHTGLASDEVWLV